MYPYIFVILMVLPTSCSISKDHSLEIIIEDASSYTYNLKNNFLIVHNITRPDTTVNLHLSQKELTDIIDKYYDLRLDRLNDKANIEDDCMIQPKPYTMIEVYSPFRHQQILIDDGCDQFKEAFQAEAMAIISFLKFTKRMLESHPEVKSLPQSDIIYL